MLKQEIKMGLAPTRRDVFSREDSLRYKSLIESKLASGASRSSMWTGSTKRACFTTAWTPSVWRSDSGLKA